MRRTTEYTAELIADMRARQAELRTDPSSVRGMTQAELNDVIDTGTIPVGLLREILDD